jgi:hypothetical protein
MATNNARDNLKKRDYFERFGIAEGLRRLAEDFPFQPRMQAGIDSDVADQGKVGRFGLQGMRERAARIGAKLTLASSSALGTEIKLVVAGGIIFQKTGSVRQTLLAKIRALISRVDGGGDSNGYVRVAR